MLWKWNIAIILRIIEIISSCHDEFDLHDQSSLKLSAIKFLFKSITFG